MKKKVNKEGEEEKAKGGRKEDGEGGKRDGE